MFFSCSLLKSLICDKAAFISIYTTQPVISGYLFLFIIFYLFMVRLPCLIFHYLPALYHPKFIFFYYILIIILGKLLKKNSIAILTVKKELCILNKIAVLFYSCGGFNTPTLCVVIKGIKADCNHLMRTTYPDALRRGC